MSCRRANSAGQGDFYRYSLLRSALTTNGDGMIFTLMINAGKALNFRLTTVVGDDNFETYQDKRRKRIRM